ncbi:MAG: T9SS type A sorting domain-containing protein [Ignavibacteria bacterium]|nr:T9SS type A sorting domain-containing protein [Ignavibacteria bacterium]
MNKIIFFITLLLFFSQNKLQSQGLNDVCTVNGLTVWAAGNGGLVMKSSEGGNYWSRVILGSGSYNSIAMKSINIWIAGDSGVLYRSSNNGTTFTLIPLPVTSNINSVIFLNANFGWLAGDNGVILVTTNSGLNWSAQTTNTNRNLNQIKFTDLSKGVACGNSGTVLYTLNGGTDWISSNTPLNKDLLSVDFSGSTIMACGKESAFIKSSDFGLNWSVINFNIESNSDINSVSMQNESSFFTTGGGGFIRASSDGGQTFSFKLNPVLAATGKIFFSGIKAWCVCNSANIILRSSDNGNHWSAQAGVTQSFSWELKIPLNYYTSSGNVFAVNPHNSKEIFVTNSVSVYRSLNTGNSWNQISTIPYFPLNSVSNGLLVSPKDTNIFLVAADSSFTETGKVFRSTNYGQNWSAVFSGRRNSDGCPLEMDPNHPDTVYYAPSDSFLYRSTNFGLNWSQVGTKRFDDICIVEVLENNSNIILVGDASTHGTLFRSTDFGITWTNVNDTLSYEIPDIANSKLNPSYVFCAFYEGVGGLKRSTDYGINWVNVNINYRAWAVDIARDDPNTFAYGTWFDNPIYLTNDGGVTFTATPVIPGGTFALYYYDRTTLLAQMSEGFYKMKINYSVPIGINQLNSEVPDDYLLSQNYPNPFNPVTKIEFEIPQYAGIDPLNVRLIVSDALGREVSVLFNQILNAGKYEVEFSGNNLPSGIYFYTLNTGKISISKRMILLK